ncbi:MAG TPA: ABC transporter permease [Ensifer sp.]|jgi:inositol transport system permease protein|uniref:ABC transporter permease n=1 Tax=Ensifer sp. TaxID=1872086 RepID=UPI002E13FC12|nr:ABC transporter permease [Ensifer sp.]
MSQQLTNVRSQWSALTSKYSIYIILVVMVIISSILSPAFFSASNFSNISSQISVTTILAFGQTLLIICGLIDLSAGSVMALAGLVAVMAFKATGSIYLGLIVGIVVGVACNFVNGIVVTKFRTPPFIATLAMMTAARGVALMLTGGQNIYQLGDFVVWGKGTVLGVPTPVVFLIVVIIFSWYLLNHTRFGRYIYAIGGNQEAARASGVQVDAIKLKAYLVNGALVGLAGVLYMSRVNAGLPNAGIGFEFDAMTAAIIGGTSFSGGIGTAVGTLAGAFIMGFLGNIMNLLGVQSYVQQIVKGAIIVLAVAYDISSKNSKIKRILGSIDEKKEAAVSNA